MKYKRSKPLYYLVFTCHQKARFLKTRNHAKHLDKIYFTDRMKMNRQTAGNTKQSGGESKTVKQISQGFVYFCLVLR